MTPGFLIAAALLALAVTAVLVWPMLRRDRAVAARRDYDLAIYRDQLDEIDRDQRRGVLEAAEADSARLEIQRRLLAADRRQDGDRRRDGEPAPAGAAARRDWFMPVALGLLVPGLTLGVYLLLGRPDVPSIDFAEQQAAVSDMAGLSEQLRARLELEPEDPRGWELLGRTYLELGRPDRAAEAFGSALSYGGEAGRLNASLGEALAAAEGGRIGAEARAAFARALEADPGEPKARYYAGLALLQDGRRAEALAVWRQLAQASPPDSPWLPTLEQAIASLAAELGAPESDAPAQDGAEAPGAGPGPTQQDVEAAGEMSRAEREAFVRAMVERLAARLEEEPGDVEGWLRLAQARQVLGERDRAVAALRRAQEALADRPAEDVWRRRVEQALQELGESP
ncbi:MAG: c-type cytochrome biogenesis protein CcmI [Tistlia sp.]|uniref:c-type cytochrome biogenesis protein CcmI n=1 Tax=Tistlia sp. TaxID=3057121 RepID=UPI0034A4968A